MGMMLRRHHPKKPAETEVINYSELTVKDLKDIARERNIEGYSTLNKEDEVINYSELTVKDLKDIARERNIEGYSTLNKEDLVVVLEG